MKYLPVILSAFVLSAVSSLSFAERIINGDWTVDHGADYNEAYTENSAGESVGFWCSTEEDNCFFYLRTNTDCQDETRTQIQAQTDAGATSFELLCHKIAHDGDYHYLYFFTDTARTRSLLEERRYIEISLPDTGKVRFSLKGSKLSIRKVAELAGK